MRTGRPKKSAAEQRLRGDPRRRGRKKVAAEVRAESNAAAAGPPVVSDGAPGGQELKPITFEVPAILTKSREREIYSRIMGEFLPKNLARETDSAAYTRYAHYLADWEFCVEALRDPQAGDGFYEVKSKHGTRLAPHPLHKRKHENELALVRLELQLGLTPLSRQSIVRGMRGLRDVLGGLFGDDGGKPADSAGDGGDRDRPPLVPASPLGYLELAANKDSDR